MMSAIDQKQPFQMAGKVVVRRIGTDILLVPVSGPAASGQVFPVNGTAECIWNCLSNGGTPQEAAERLAESFDVGPAEALKDCLECTQAFLDQKLLAEAGS